MFPILREAVRAAGSMTELAAGLQISRQAIYNWRRIPAERVIDIEAITGIDRARLRPDLFGKDIKRRVKVR